MYGVYEVYENISTQLRTLFLTMDEMDEVHENIPTQLRPFCLIMYVMFVMYVILPADNEHL